MKQRNIKQYENNKYKQNILQKLTFFKGHSSMRCAFTLLIDTIRFIYSGRQILVKNDMSQEVQPLPKAPTRFLPTSRSDSSGKSRVRFPPPNLFIISIMAQLWSGQRLRSQILTCRGYNRSHRNQKISHWPITPWTQSIVKNQEKVVLKEVRKCIPANQPVPSAWMTGEVAARTKSYSGVAPGTGRRVVFQGLKMLRVGTGLVCFIAYLEAVCTCIKAL